MRITLFKKGSAAIERVNEVMNQKEEASGPALYSELDFQHQIEFKEVSFAYASGEKVLSDINLVIKKGEKNRFSRKFRSRKINNC